MGRSRGARWDRINGVLLLDKPRGMTSNAALQSARRLLNAAKAGHTGTLDPMATGLLPLTFGEATKFSADLLNADKSYRATIKLGVTTTSGDADGTVVAIREVSVSNEELIETLTRFVGTIEQVPPMHSALKHDGQPLYKLARAGGEVARAPRQISVHRLVLVEHREDELVIDVDCSKGTYVRVLAEDIGMALGCGAHLSALRRTRAGRLSVDDAVTLATLETMAPELRRAGLLPEDELLGSLATVLLDAAHTARFRQGQRLALDAEPRNSRVRVYGGGNELLGTATINEWGVVEPQRLVTNN
ncbi:MAG TPA: tRNA pseudouridine(55) synthase TruB [Burkholderiaceae bacterium]|nr:tRNA pseudouridine(55) synthase TruB [Burkholderiaceae bacterium]